MLRQAGATLGMLFLAHAAAAQFAPQNSETAGSDAVGCAQQSLSVAFAADGSDATAGGLVQAASTQSIFSDGFEGSFPGSQWQLMYSSAGGTNQTVRWGKSTYRSAGGTASIWCAGGGSNPQSAGGPYLANMGTFAIYGPFSLADATAAALDFDTWYITQASHDFLYPMVSTDGTNYHGGLSFSGNSGGWTHKTIDLAGIPGVVPIGAPQVWIALVFTSDTSTQMEGVYVDNVAITKTTSAPACAYSLNPTSASFSSSAGSGTVTVTVTSGSGCGWTATSNTSGWLHVTSGASGTGNGTVGYTVDANSGSARSGTLTIAGQTFTANQSGGGVSYAYSYWIPAASHNPGKGTSQWRSDLGLLNRGTVAANVQIQFYGSGGLVSNTTYVPAKTQSILVDVVNQLPASNSGAIQVLSDQPLLVTSRSYNQDPSGMTFGQGYDGVVSSDCLTAGQTAWLPQLTQSGIAGQVGTYRTNIGITNAGSGNANVTLVLYDANGTQVWSDTRDYTPGLFYQYQEPYRTGAGRVDIGQGYATVRVNTGSGVIAYASVTDNASSDPTTITMKR